MSSISIVKRNINSGYGLWLHHLRRKSCVSSYWQCQVMSVLYYNTKFPFLHSHLIKLHFPCILSMSFHRYCLFSSFLLKCILNDLLCCRNSTETLLTIICLPSPFLCQSQGRWTKCIQAGTRTILSISNACTMYSVYFSMTCHVMTLVG